MNQPIHIAINRTVKPGHDKEIVYLVGMTVLDDPVLRLFGKMEIEIQQAVHTVEQEVEGVEVGFYPNFPEIHLTLTARGPEHPPLKERVERFIVALHQEVGDILL